MAAAVYTEITLLQRKLYLLDTFIVVQTHIDITGHVLFVDGDSGSLTGEINFDGARTEAFGINMFTLYESHVDSLEVRHWTAHEMPAGEQYPGLFVSKVLT